ncbi:hypothetical protein GCM10022205_31280 [Spinactinospora alkalitolerans]
MARAASSSAPHRSPIAEPCGGIMIRLRSRIVPIRIGEKTCGNAAPPRSAGAEVFDVVVTCVSRVVPAPSTAVAWARGAPTGG